MRPVAQSVVPAALAFLSALLVMATYLVLDRIARGLSIQTGDVMTGLTWSLYAALYAAVAGLALVRLRRTFWWVVVAVGVAPLLIAAIVTWPPPHLVKVCIPEIDCGPRNYHLEWGQQRDAWPYYLYPLVKYALTFPVACIAYFVVHTLQMRSNPSLERP